METTVTYAYTDTVWADRLTNFNGTAIEYDEIGNPLNWHSGATMTWQHGRQLASFNRGVYRVSYGYNQDGIRTSKTVNGFLYTYEVVDGTLRRFSAGGNTLEFINGTSVIFNGTEYWYVFNAQNDVIGIIDASGNYVVEYTYDSWGKILSKTGTMASTLGYLNPFRYRGYIYDEETGLYYCQSRYYDPAVGRWLNADGVVADVGKPKGYNQYVYCFNDPINKHDSMGMWPTWNDFTTAVSKGWNDFTTAVSDGWNEVKTAVSNGYKAVSTWANDTFGFGVVQSHSYEIMNAKTVFGGIEGGNSTSKVICGDISKPISFYAVNASEWWKVWEYKIGFQVNFEHTSYGYETNMLQTSYHGSVGDTTLEATFGVNKIGGTISTGGNFRNRTHESYAHAYIRTLPCVGAVALAYYAGAAAGASAAAAVLSGGLFAVL